jgi:hypothetical protein
LLQWFGGRELARLIALTRWVTESHGRK